MCIRDRGEVADEVFAEVVEHDDIGHPEQLPRAHRHEAGVPGPGTDEGDPAASDRGLTQRHPGRNRLCLLYTSRCV